MVETPHSTELLIVGAGPFGLALAAQAQHDHIEHLIVGKPMEFWRAILWVYEFSANFGTIDLSQIDK